MARPCWYISSLLLPSLGEDLHEVISEISSSEVETQDGVRKCVTLVNWDRVSDAIAGVENDAGGTAGSVQGKHGLRIDWQVNYDYIAGRFPLYNARLGQAETCAGINF